MRKRKPNTFVQCIAIAAMLLFWRAVPTAFGQASELTRDAHSAIDALGAHATAVEVERDAARQALEKANQEIERLKKLIPAEQPEEPGAPAFPIAADLPAIAHFIGPRWAGVPDLVAVHPNGIESVTVEGVEALRYDGDYFKLPPIDGQGKRRVTVTITPTHGKPSTLAIDVFLGEIPRKQLQAGRYSVNDFPGGKDTWLIVEPAPGVSRDDVVFNDGTRAKGKLCLRNVTLTYPIKAATDARKDAALWLDGVTYKGPGASVTGSDVSRFDAGEFWTRCKVSDLHLAGASGLVYDCEFSKIGEDLIRGASAVVKVRVSDCRDFSAHGKWHGDFVVNPNGADEPLLFYDITVRNSTFEMGWGTGGRNTYLGAAWVKVDVESERVNLDIESKYPERVLPFAYIRDAKFWGGRFDVSGVDGPVIIDNVLRYEPAKKDRDGKEIEPAKFVRPVAVQGKVYVR